MFRIASEGWPFIYVTAGLTLIFYGLFRPWVAVFPLILMLFMVFFFRDPERVIPEGRGLVVSPADGKVIRIRTGAEDSLLASPGTSISIFMSPFNVHVNRAPLDGTVEDVIHREGRFRPAYSDEAPLENESTTMILSTSYGQVLVRQIAGILARRTVCRVKPGDSLSRGERYGLIKFGSRVDIYLPKSAEILVKVDDRVKAGSTVIARMVEK